MYRVRPQVDVSLCWTYSTDQTRPNANLTLGLLSGFTWGLLFVSSISSSVCFSAK